MKEWGFEDGLWDPEEVWTEGRKAETDVLLQHQKKTGDWILGSGSRGGGMGGRVLPISPLFIVKVTQRKLCMAFFAFFLSPPIEIILKLSKDQISIFIFWH